MQGRSEPSRGERDAADRRGRVDRGSVAGDSALSFLSLGIMAVGKALFIILTANFYGPGGQGIVTLGITMTVTVALFSGLGTERANTLLAGRNVDLTILHRNAAGLSLATLFVSVPLVELAYHAFYSSIFAGFPATARLWVMLLIPLQVYHRQVEGLHVGIGRFRPLAEGIALQFGAVLVGLLLLRVLDRPAGDVLGLWALGLLIKGLYTAGRLPRPESGSSRSALPILREQIRKGLQMLLGDATNLLNLRLDAYFITFFGSMESLGLYAVATLVAEGVLYIPKAFARVLFSRAASNGKSSVSGILVSRVFLVAWACTLGAILVIQAFYAPLIDVVFGEKFDRAVPAGRILLVAVLFYGLGVMAMNLLFGLGHAVRNARVGLIALLVNVVANALAIPAFGILGAALASLVSYSTYFTLNLANVRRSLPPEIRTRDFFVPRSDDLRRLRALITIGVRGDWRD